MKYNVIKDTSILAVNRGGEGKAPGIVYYDKKGALHTVDFATCAANFKAEHPNAKNLYIGVRHAENYYFLLYTDGIKTKIHFKKRNVRGLFYYHRFTGRREDRFDALHKLITQAGYATYDKSQKPT